VVAPEEAEALPDHRRLGVAATGSRSAAVSTRGELCPRGMEAYRAVRLSHGSLLFDARPGGDEAVLTEGEVRERVASRYPEAAPLPPRPALDDLLDRAGTMLVWDDGKSGYKRRTVEGIDTKGSTQFTRASSWGHRRTALLSPEAAEGQAFDERLRHALEAGSFLSLTVRPRYFEEAQAHLLETFGLGRVSVDALLIESMRTHAEELEVQWDVVLSADTAQNGQDSQDWTNLLRLARMAAADLDARVLAAKQPTMLVHLGLLARYELMELVEGWRDTSGRSDGPPAIWLLHPAPEQELPVIDGIAVPLLNRSQHARVPEAWLGYRPKRDDDAASA